MSPGAGRFTQPDLLPPGRRHARGAYGAPAQDEAVRAAYALHKQAVEPVFGIAKSVLVTASFFLRGPEHASGE